MTTARRDRAFKASKFHQKTIIPRMAGVVLITLVLAIILTKKTLTRMSINQSNLQPNLRQNHFLEYLLFLAKNCHCAEASRRLLPINLGKNPSHLLAYPLLSWPLLQQCQFGYQQRSKLSVYPLYLKASIIPDSNTDTTYTNGSQGRDCIGNAKTGSGKTIAFALPILQKLSVDPYGIFALVLTPTR